MAPMARVVVLGEALHVKRRGVRRMETLHEGADRRVYFEPLAEARGRAGPAGPTARWGTTFI